MRLLTKQQKMENKANYQREQRETVWDDNYLLNNSEPFYNFERIEYGYGSDIRVRVCKLRKNYFNESKIKQPRVQHFKLFMKFHNYIAHQACNNNKSLEIKKEEIKTEEIKEPVIKPVVKETERVRKVAKNGMVFLIKTLPKKNIVDKTITIDTNTINTNSNNKCYHTENVENKSVSRKTNSNTTIKNNNLHTVTNSNKKFKEITVIDDVYGKYTKKIEIDTKTKWFKHTLGNGYYMNPDYEGDPDESDSESDEEEE